MWCRPDGGTHRGMTDHLQNDPERAGGLISDAQGEFVAQEPGGVFDPRAFRSSSPDGDGSSPEADSSSDGEPPMDEERMVGPGEEIDKTR